MGKRDLAGRAVLLRERTEAARLGQGSRRGWGGKGNEKPGRESSQELEAAVGGVGCAGQGLGSCSSLSFGGLSDFWAAQLQGGRFRS